MQGIVSKAGRFLRAVATAVSTRERPRWPLSTLHIETTAACNLKCTYCVLDEKMPDKAVMDIERFRSLSPYFKWLKDISLSGLAEPLINKNISECIRIVKHEAPMCWTALFTNAMLLSEAVSEELIDSGLDSLNFSLDGVTPEVVDRIRRGGDLLKVIENIRGLGRVKNRKNVKNPQLIATTVLYRQNYRELPRIVELAAQLGVSRLDVNGLEPYTEDMVESILWGPGMVPEDLPDVLEETKEALKKNSALSVGFASLIPTEESLCYEVSRPLILANGDVTPCAVLAYDRDYFFKIDPYGKLVRTRGVCVTRVFGNVFERPLEEIWLDKPYKEFRERIQRGDFPPECESCMIKHQFICVRANFTINDILRQSREIVERYKKPA